MNRYKGFASPHEPIDIALLEEIATTHFRRALRTFVSRHRALIEQHEGSGLIALFQRWFDEPTKFETVWHVSFGKMREVIAEQFRPPTPAEVLLSAARIGLRLTETGTKGAWTLAMGEAHRLRYGDFVLPEGERVQVTDRGVSLDGAHPIPTFDVGDRPLRVLLADTPEGFENKEYPVATGELPEILKGYRGAFGVLAEYAPIYLPFVKRLLRNLVPVRAAPGGYIGGGSLRDNPGTVKLPFERELSGLAANLGHECAHQHYFLLRGAGRVEDRSDQNLYTCAFVEGDRDLPSLVLTYHAFANEAIVLRMCERGGLDDGGYGADRGARIFENLMPIEEILSKSTALTATGRALIFPVKERMHELFDE